MPFITLVLGPNSEFVLVQMEFWDRGLFGKLKSEKTVQTQFKL